MQGWVVRRELVLTVPYACGARCLFKEECCHSWKIARSRGLSFASHLIAKDFALFGEEVIVVMGLAVVTTTVLEM